MVDWLRGELEREQEGTARVEYRAISCAELDRSAYDLEYLVEGVLVARQPCIVAGGKKCLKTSILIDLGIALAMGVAVIVMSTLKTLDVNTGVSMLGMGLTALALANLQDA